MSEFVYLFRIGETEQRQAMGTPKPPWVSWSFAEEIAPWRANISPLRSKWRETIPNADPSSRLSDVVRQCLSGTGTSRLVRLT
jgi:hypothetical protein